VSLKQDVLTVDKARNCINGVLLGACVEVRVIAGTWLDVSSCNTQAPRQQFVKRDDALSDALNL
jgi:hypothetical protein